MELSNDIKIQQLNQILNLLKIQKKEDSLTPKDREVLLLASNYFNLKNNYSRFLKISPFEILNLIKDLKKDGEIVKKGKEQENSIPPELESMVAEYQNAQQILQEENTRSDAKRTVAEQVKIAIAHSKKKQFALQNKNGRIEKGEKFETLDKAIIANGSPKSKSIDEAFSKSYEIIEEVASTYEEYNSLSSESKTRVLSEAVELFNINISNASVALETASLLIDSTDLPQTDQKNISKISSGYVHSVYDAINSQTQQAATYESEIAENEIVLLQLNNEAKQLKGTALEGKKSQIKTLLDKNQRLNTKIENLPHQFEIFINNQETPFKQFESNSKKILRSDPDFDVKTQEAMKEVSKIHERLQNKGIQARIFSEMDSAKLLEDAINSEMPNLIHFGSYGAGIAEGLADDPFIIDDNHSPQAIHLLGLGLTPEAFAKVQAFAKENPNSEIGKLYAKNKGLFNTARIQLRKLFQSTLGKEITKGDTALGKVLKPFSNTLGKASSLLGKAGFVIRVIQNPFGALKSWAGKKVGKYLKKQILNRLSKKIFKEGAEILFEKGVKKAIIHFTGKLIAQTAAKYAIKTGTKIAIESVAQAANGVIPGLGIVIAIVVEIVFWIGEKTIGVLKNAVESLYGEKIKSYELIAVPVAAIGTVVTGVIGFFTFLAAATVVAVGSAVAIVIISVIISFFFYLTSIATAPLISTIVQLESTPQTGISGRPNSCANLDGIFVSQRDPQWSNTYCSTCSTAGSCSIGKSGCGTTAATIILNSFGLVNGNVNNWTEQHSSGGYAYYDANGNLTSVTPYQGCASRWSGPINILTDGGLAVTSIGKNFDEADNVINNCGLILSVGNLACSSESGWCGHFLVIVSHDGNQITTMDPWSGENFVHTLDSTFQVTHMWAVVP